MKSIFSFLFIASVFGCSSNKKLEISKEEKSVQTLFKKLKAVNINTFEVNSYNSDDLKDKFIGIPIDTLEVKLFPEDYNLDEYYGSPSIFACYRFSIDTKKQGLIMRTSGMYDISSITLFVYDTEKDSITESILLAESFGDMGYFKITKSWIIKEEYKYLLLSEIESGCDNNEGKELRYFYNLIDLSNQSVPLSKDSIYLVNQYENLVKK